MAARGRLQGKNAVITGAGGGIGLETTILFAREGANVLMADISEPALERAQAKVKEVVPQAPRVETIKCDVSKESDVQRMIELQDSWGGTDVVFNNAGIMHADDADAVDTPEKIWDLTHSINVKGVWFGSKHAVQSMRRNKKTRGSIINTASVVALVGAATPQLAYTASKGAVLAMTRELAIVHAREGFRFNALCPAPLKYAPRYLPVSQLLTVIALLSCKTGWATTSPSVSVVRCTSPPVVSVRPLNRPMQWSSWPVTRAALSMEVTLLLTVECPRYVYL